MLPFFNLLSQHGRRFHSWRWQYSSVEAKKAVLFLCISPFLTLSCNFVYFVHQTFGGIVSSKAHKCTERTFCNCSSPAPPGVTFSEEVKISVLHLFQSVSRCISLGISKKWEGVINALCLIVENHLGWCLDFLGRNRMLGWVKVECVQTAHLGKCGDIH